MRCEYIIDTLKANPAAIDNVDEFKKTMDTFEAPNPFLTTEDAKLTYVGSTSFGQKRQLSVPMVVNEYKDGKFETLFVGAGRLILPTRGSGARRRTLPAEEPPWNRSSSTGSTSARPYALIALGLTLIFALMNVLNFAHGQMYVLGGFITYTVYAQLGLPFVVGLLASSVTLAVIGGLCERFLFAPVIRRSKRDESTMLLAAGLAFFFDAVILLIFGEKQRGVPKILNGVLNWDFRVIIPYDRILVFVLAIVFIAGFILFMQYSRTGRALRALAQDRVAAQLMGVDVERYSTIGFALGAMLAGLVGGLLVSIIGVNLGMGGPTSIKAFMMVMIGGAGVISGAIAGGFILGMLESVGLTVLAAYGDITYLVIFASLMVFLAIRPQRADGQALGLNR